MNDIQDKITAVLESLVVVLWFFVASISVGIIGCAYNSFVVPKVKVLPKLTLKRLLLIFTTFCFGVFWYLKDIRSRTHFLFKENDRYKFIDAEFSQISIIYGTIVAEPDIREDATHIIIKPDRIITSPRIRYTIELDTSSAKIFVEEEVVTKVIDGDTFITKNNNRVRLMGINAPEIGQPKAEIATKFLKQKVLNKKVKLIIQEDYMFDIYNRILAVVIVDGENINKLLVDNGFAEIYSDPNIKIIKKVLTYKGEEIKIRSKSILIRARVKPTVGDYYFKISYGDYVKVVSPLLLPKGSQNFTTSDYRKYLYAQGIYAVTKTLRDPYEIEYLGRGKVNFIVKLIFVLRRRILTILKKVILYQHNK